MDRRHFTMALLSAALPAAGAGDAEAQKRCAQLQRRIEELRLKLRMGYTAKQGRQWRARLAGMEKEYRELCR